MNDNRESPAAPPKHHCDVALMRRVRARMARVVDQRAEPRFPPPARAALGLRVAGRPAPLRDLSASGLRIGVELAQASGAEVAVAFAGCEPLAGTVMWTGEGATGVRLPREALDLYQSH